MPLPIIGAVAVGTLLRGLWAWFSRLIMSRGGKWLAAALVAIGINIAVTGATILPFVAQARDAWGGIPFEIAQWMGVIQVDVYVSMLISAHLIKQLKQAGRMRIISAGRR